MKFKSVFRKFQKNRTKKDGVVVVENEVVNPSKAKLPFTTTTTTKSPASSSSSSAKEDAGMLASNSSLTVMIDSSMSDSSLPSSPSSSQDEGEITIKQEVFDTEKHESVPSSPSTTTTKTIEEEEEDEDDHDTEFLLASDDHSWASFGANHFFSQHPFNEDVDANAVANAVAVAAAAAAAEEQQQQQEEEIDLDRYLESEMAPLQGNVEQHDDDDDDPKQDNVIDNPEDEVSLHEPLVPSQDETHVSSSADVSLEEPPTCTLSNNATPTSLQLEESLVHRHPHVSSPADVSLEEPPTCTLSNNETPTSLQQEEPLLHLHHHQEEEDTPAVRSFTMPTAASNTAAAVAAPASIASSLSISEATTTTSKSERSDASAAPIQELQSHDNAEDYVDDDSMMQQLYHEDGISVLSGLTTSTSHKEDGWHLGYQLSEIFMDALCLACAPPAATPRYDDDDDDDDCLTYHA